VVTEVSPSTKHTIRIRITTKD